MKQHWVSVSSLLVWAMQHSPVSLQIFLSSGLAGVGQVVLMVVFG